MNNRFNNQNSQNNQSKSSQNNSQNNNQHNSQNNNRSNSQITTRVTIRITEAAKTKTATAISDNLIFIYYRKRVGIGAQADTHPGLFILVF